MNLSEIMKNEILTSCFSSFLAIFPKFVDLSENDKKRFLIALSIYKNTNSELTARQSSYYIMFEILFSNKVKEEVTSEEDTIIIKQTKNTKVKNPKLKNKESKVPCEICNQIPTSKIKINLKDREEIHYYCKEHENNN